MRFATGLPIKPNEFGIDRPVEVKKKEPYRPQPKQPPGPNDWLLRNSSQEQARASQLEHARRQGEREE